MSYFKHTLRRFLKPSLIGLLLILIAFAPFNFKETQAAGFCDWSVTKSLCEPFATVIADILMIPMTIAAWILWLSGVFLNTVLNYTVVNLSDNINNLSGINIVWATIRDVSNMVFIFILLYVAIGTILGVAKSDWKNTLKNIVIAAVLINFSLLIPKVVIDASNVFTLGIYKQIVPETYSLSTGGGMSNVIMKPLGLTSLYNPMAGGKNLAELADYDLSKIAIRSIMGAVFMLATAGVFFGVVAMFIIRYITIIFLIIFSPVAVMSTTLPQLSSYAKKWTEQLTGQAIFAPVFMLLLWGILTIINSPGFLCDATGANSASLGNTLTGIPSSAMAGTNVCSDLGLIFNFVIVIAFVSAILGIAQKVSKQGGGEIQTVVGKAFGFGFGSTLGFAGRSTLGRVGRSLADSETLKDRASKSGVRGFMARQTLKSANYTAGSTFDVRGAKTFLGQDMKSLGIGGKAGGKGGYDGALKTYADEKTKFSKTLTASERTKERAKQAVMDAASEDPGRIRLYAERRLRDAERTRAEKDYNNASAQFAYAQSLNLDVDSAEYKKYESELNEKKKALEIARNKASMDDDAMARDVKNTRIAEAEEKSNRINGINDEEMRKQVIKRIARERNISEEEATRVIKAEEISTKGIQNIGNVRRERYAESLTTGRTGIKRVIPDTNRRFFLGAIRRENREAARAIRKEVKGKSAAEEVMEKLTKEVEKNNPKPVDAPAPGSETAGEGDTAKK